MLCCLNEFHGAGVPLRGNARPSILVRCNELLNHSIAENFRKFVVGVQVTH